MYTEAALFSHQNSAVFHFEKLEPGIGGIAMENDYNKIAKKNAHQSMAITVQGHEVTLLFADEPNTQIALKIKQALLGTYLTAEK